MFLDTYPDPDRMMDGSYGDGMMDGGWGFAMMAILGLLLVVMVGITAYLALRTTGPRQPAPGPGAEGTPATPRDVLDLRLARGEISQEEYSSTRTILSS